MFKNVLTCSQLKIGHFHLHLGECSGQGQLELQRVDTARSRPHAPSVKENAARTAISRSRAAHDDVVVTYYGLNP